MILAELFTPFAWIWHDVVPFLVLITPVIFFHELGHFSVARACGVKVETFSIGFGPTIASWFDRKGTQWKLCWLPFGGYVRFFGDMDAASVPDRQGMDEMPAADRAVAFPFKPLYQRALIVAAGPVANFILAIVILTALLLAFGRGISLPVVAGLVKGGPAAAAGIRPGDVITQINDRRIESFDDIPNYLWVRPVEPLTVTVERDGKPLKFHFTPTVMALKDQLGEVHRVPALGISTKITAQTYRVIHYGPIGAFAGACGEVWDIVRSTFGYLGRMATGSVNASELQGPVGIAAISGKVASISFLALINLAALISVSIGLVNLFPIPILDGGHLLYYGCEAVLGRPLGARAQDVGFRLGLAFILGLFVLLTWNDLVRLNLF
jgi:regulator of sigma E protease